MFGPSDSIVYFCAQKVFAEINIFIRKVFIMINTFA